MVIKIQINSMSNYWQAWSYTYCWHYRLPHKLNLQSVTYRKEEESDSNIHNKQLHLSIMHRERMASYFIRHTGLGKGFFSMCLGCLYWFGLFSGFLVVVSQRKEIAYFAAKSDFSIENKQCSHCSAPLLDITRGFH